jgi:hypothetical protein
MMARSSFLVQGAGVGATVIVLAATGCAAPVETQPQDETAGTAVQAEVTPHVSPTVGEGFARASGSGSGSGTVFDVAALERGFGLARGDGSGSGAGSGSGLAFASGSGSGSGTAFAAGSGSAGAL